MNSEPSRLLTAGVFALAATWSSIGPAAAASADDPMANFYGNTEICQEVGVFECHIWFFPNGKFVQFSYDLLRQADGGPGFITQDGMYTVKPNGAGLEMCSKLEGDQEHCAPFSPRQLGDSWSDTPTDGRLKGTIENFWLVKGYK